MTHAQLDYYNGRHIQEILENDDMTYTIVYQGNKRITIAQDLDSRLEVGMMQAEVAPYGDELEIKYCRIIQGEVDHQLSVIVAEGDYHIADEEHPAGPQPPEISESTPPDPSSDRDKGEATP